MRANDILDQKGYDVVTLGPDALLAEAIDLLAARNIGAVVIVEDRRPVGIVSERDVVRLLSGAPTGFRETRIDGLMTKTVFTAGPEASIDELMDLMTDRRIRHVPVVKGGDLVGILSIGDVVKHRIREAITEAEELKGYIQG